ncbi:unnamed protein product [Haemonchus placei]|uniref:Uncharacterized protein n=1 Tax=Haemonchus placei TaxID=6290 RepID=A0A0N4VZK6_HAEPC|nr:unnamed protein product [Haemonchus placei]
MARFLRARNQRANLEPGKVRPEITSNFRLTGEAKILTASLEDAEVQNFGDQKAIHDEAHMKEHLKDKIGIDAPMSEEQKRLVFL